MRTLIKLSLLIILIIAGCKKEETAQTNTLILNDNIDLKLKAFSLNDKLNISISFDSVLNDSRCPVNAECFWAGIAEVSFTFSVNNNKVSFNLSTPQYGTNIPFFKNDSTIMGYNIRLLTLYSYIKPDDMVKFLITRK